METIEAFDHEIGSKGYRYMRPGLETTPWGTLETGVIDPLVISSVYSSRSSNR
jgi:hypothetical protein